MTKQESYSQWARRVVDGAPTPEREEALRLIREWHTAGSKKRWHTSCWHRAPDEVIAAVVALAADLEAAEREVERLLKHEERAAERHPAEDARKIEAYDRARAHVKIEGATRAEYVLRAEAAEKRKRELEQFLEEDAIKLEAAEKNMKWLADKNVEIQRWADEKIQAAERERDETRAHEAGFVQVGQHWKAKAEAAERDLATARETLRKIKLRAKTAPAEPVWQLPNEIVALVDAALRSLDTISNPVAEPPPAKVEPWTESQLEAVRRLRYDRSKEKETS